MHSNLYIVVGLIFVAILGCDAQPPTPNNYPGHTLGSPGAPIFFEVFFDLLCSDSMNAWPTIKQVQAQYAKDLYFIMHIMPLPYHRNAFFAAQAGELIDSMISNASWWAWLELMFEHQPQFYVPATMNATGSEVVEMLASYAVPLGITKQNFLNGMEYGGEADADTRINWKFAAARGIYGTPEFYVNGVFVTDDGTWTVKEWSQFLEGLLGGVDVMTARRMVKK